MTIRWFALTALVCAALAVLCEAGAKNEDRAQGAVTREQWRQSASGARTPLGKLVSRKVKSREYTGTLPGAPDGKYVVIQFNTVFSSKASAVETITPMLEPDGVWRVSGYFVR